MGQKQLRVWYDGDADLIEVFFDGDSGYYEPTEDDRVTVRLDAQGNIIGFSILSVKTTKDDPINIALTSSEREEISRD